MYTSTHAPNEAIAAIAWPLHPKYSPVCPKRTKARSLWPRLPSENAMVLLTAPVLPFNKYCVRFLRLSSGARVDDRCYRSARAVPDVERDRAPIGMDAFHRTKQLVLIRFVCSSGLPGVRAPLVARASRSRTRRAGQPE